MQLPSGHPCIAFRFAKRFGVLVLEHDAQRTLLYKAGLDIDVLLEVQRYCGIPEHCQILDEQAFNSALTRAYERQSATTLQLSSNIDDELNLEQLVDSVASVTEDLLDQENDAPVIRLINAILTQAVKNQASDIHIEVFENRVRVRFRVDGILQDILEPKRQLAQLLISRIKVMSKMDIAEKRLPQDGRISILIGGREVDIRVSTIPTRHGERAVLRLLDKKTGRLELAALGMAAQDQVLFESVVSKPHGIILVTGPTGSGKTTTLYSALTHLNTGACNIMTVEDPIEYDLSGIAQTQVSTKSDMTFARGLRAILRQDPDVVMVGEIRDLETAQIAIQASLTGHLVLSTLHTNSPVGAITRLQDMGIPSYLLSSSLLAVVGQRLVRVLCTACRERRPLSIQERPTQEKSDLYWMDAEMDESTSYYPIGCAECHRQGYKGRTGIYELLVLDSATRQMVHDEVGEQALITAFRRQHGSMMSDGRRLVRAGVTSVEEVLRVCQES